MRIKSAPPARRQADQMPMINIVFLMLVFFLLAGVIAPPADLEVTPPSADAAPDGSRGAAVYVSSQGKLSFRATAVTIEDLPNALARAAPEAEENLRIVADRAADGQQLIDIIAAARQAGISRVLLATRPPAP